MRKLQAIILILLLNQESSTKGDESYGEYGKELNISPLVIDGERFERGAFPWLVALLYTANNQEKFFCGGVLVNNATVLTGKISLRVESNLIMRKQN